MYTAETTTEVLSPFFYPLATFLLPTMVFSYLLHTLPILLLTFLISTFLLSTFIYLQSSLYLLYTTFFLPVTFLSLSSSPYLLYFPLFFLLTFFPHLSFPTFLSLCVSPPSSSCLLLPTVLHPNCPLPSASP